jgi:hypothetical protein
VNRKLAYLPIFLVLTLAFTPLVFAGENDVSLTDFPQYLGSNLGITLFQAQILCSCIVLALFMLPVLFWDRGTHPLGTLVVGFSVLSFCVAMTWFPIWSFAVIVLLIAVMLGMKFKDAI